MTRVAVKKNISIFLSKLKLKVVYFPSICELTMCVFSQSSPRQPILPMCNFKAQQLLKDRTCVIIDARRPSRKHEREEKNAGWYQDQGVNTFSQLEIRSSVLTFKINMKNIITSALLVFTTASAFVTQAPKKSSGVVSKKDTSLNYLGGRYGYDSYEDFGYAGYGGRGNPYGAQVSSSFECWLIWYIPTLHSSRGICSVSWSRFVYVIELCSDFRPCMSLPRSFCRII